MGRISRHVVAPLVASLLASALLLTLAPAGAAHERRSGRAPRATLTDRQRARRGLAFIADGQRPNGSIPAFSPIGSTSDAVLAFVAAGVGRPQVRDALRFLRRQVVAANVTDIGQIAKVLMAVAAAGRDPRSFGDTNLVRAIRSQTDGEGHIGDAAVLDQALAVLALESARATPQRSVTRWLRRAQCPDGGWAFDAPYAPGTDDDHCDDGSGTDFFPSDSNTTAYAVQGLEAANRGSYRADPFAYFHLVRDRTHWGWSFSMGFIATDTNSTALVIQAYMAAARPLPARGLRALRALQYRRCGGWAFTWDGTAKGDPDVGATIGAVPGILKEPLPISGPVAGAVRSRAGC
jgi:hypothetical protein